MFKDKLNGLKNSLLKKTEENNKKNIENLVAFIILLIITIIAINTIWGTENSKSKTEEENSLFKELAVNDSLNSNNKTSNEYNLDESLEDILSKIEGVGKTKVLITYSESTETVAMYNEKYTSSSTEESDTSGGKRKIDESNIDREIIFEEVDGEKTPVVSKVIMPKIEGAVITAEGASNINIKNNIIQAVAAATGLPSYRIQVFEMSI